MTPQVRTTESARVDRETPTLSGGPTAHASAQPAPRQDHFSILTGYGDDRIVLMVKDPWWLYAYWEIQPGTERAAHSQLLPQEVSGLQSVLRVYDVTETAGQLPSDSRFVDLRLSGLATNWFIHTNAPNHAFLAEVGFLTKGGRFLPLARSNRVTAPRSGPSEIIDEFWASPDEAYWKLFGASAGVGIGSSPLAWSGAPAPERTQTHPQFARQRPGGGAAS